MMAGEAHADELAQSEFVEEKFFFDPDFNAMQLADSRTYTSSPRKRERLEDSQNRLRMNRDYFMGIFSDIAYIATSPLRWDNSDWMKVAWVAGGTGLFLVLDEEIRDGFEDSRSSTTDDVSEFFERFGNGAISLPALGAFYLYGYFGENAKAERTALIAVESFLVTGLFTTVLKTVAGRHRPSTGDSSTSFDGFTTDHGSFPSGHTSTVFAIATVIANEYEDVPFIKPISYGIATMTGLSRINDEKHWASDIFLGAALGYFTSKTLLRLHSNKKGQHFTIYPRADRNGGGIVLAKRF
ncbi:MAG: membrane-associated phospholipid phosphatase [Nitrospinales bacterium]|jgi:membrane-associated phospholipid phosphatase